MKRRKRLSDLCIALGIVFMLGAVSLTLYNEYESGRSEAEKDQILTVLQEKAVLTPQETSPQQPQETKEPLPDTPADFKTEMTEVIVDGYGYIGSLSLLSLDAEFPIMSGWNGERLKIAPCRYFGSAFTDDLIIAGHNYRKGFGMLKKLKTGDCVVFTDMDGNSYEYVVDLIEVLQAEDIDGMVNSPWELSLYTCTYDGQSRLTVRCKRTDK